MPCCAAAIPSSVYASFWARTCCECSGRLRRRQVDDGVGPHFRNGELRAPFLDRVILQLRFLAIEGRQLAARIGAQHAYAKALDGILAIIEQMHTGLPA